MAALNDVLFGNNIQHFFASSVWGIEDGKRAGSMFTRVPEGAEDLREEILPKCHFIGMAAAKPVP